MRRLFLALGLLILVGGGLWLVWPARQIDAAPPHPPLGINLAGVVDWSTEIVFVDALRSSRPWVSQATGKPFGQGGELVVDARGTIKRLRPDQFAETLMYVDIGAHYPGGKYRLTYDGDGLVDISGSGSITKDDGSRKEVTVTPTKGMLSLKVTKTNPENPVRNLRLVMDQYANQSSPFYPAFVQRYQGFRALRFMDWQRINNSKQTTWADRATPNDATQASDKGVCLELMVALANTLDIDPWFCIPHLADDDYVRRMAQLINEQLKPERKVYIEYSNETWNGQFAQAKYCQRQGKEFGLSKNDYEAQLRFAAQRSVAVFGLVSAVLGKERLVRVLAAQAANPWTGTTIMDWKDAAKHADAIAIAPYFGNSFGDPKHADQTAKMTVAQLLDACTTEIAQNKESLTTYAREAKNRGLQLLAYESGQHLVGHSGAENNTTLLQLFHDTNRHPRMKDVYLRDLQQWKDLGGGLNCVFSSVGRYTKWGSWGLLEYSDQDETLASKMQAIRAFIEQGKK